MRVMLANSVSISADTYIYLFLCASARDARLQPLVDPLLDSVLGVRL